MYRDHWAKKAKLDGFRSRAVYKIIEIDQKVDLFKNVFTILDIGSAPGGWSEYVSKKCPQNNIFAKFNRIFCLCRKQKNKVS